MSISLTARQRQILNFIQDFQQRHARPPTQVEITDFMGFRSRTATRDHLRALANKAVLELQPGSSRGIRLLGEYAPSLNDSTYSVPLIGRVAAGQPILAMEHIETHYQVPLQLFQPRADYLLRVVGLSMRDAGILDGDLLAVRRASEARMRQIVVARLDEEVTVKRFWREGSRVELQAENPDFSNITVDLRRQSFNLEGVMVGLIRQSEASASL